MFNLDIILDRSDNPKLSGTKAWHIWGIILSCIIMGLIIFLMVTNGITVGTIIRLIISLIVLIIFIIITAKADKKFKQKNSIHGVMELGYFNGKEVGVFKSNYNEVIMLDFENIIDKHRSHSMLSKGEQITYLKINNKNTTVLYGGQLIKCAISLIIKDKNLLNYMVEHEYIELDNDFDDD